MDRRTRICLWIIVLGLVNFIAYTLAYTAIGGDAMNGYVRLVRPAGGHGHTQYWLSRSGQAFQVSRGVWIYSAIHSISIWVTVGAVMLALLTLSKDRVVASMRGTLVRGRTFLTILATLIVFITVVITVHFVLYAIRQLAWPQVVAPGVTG